MSIDNLNLSLFINKEKRGKKLVVENEQFKLPIIHLLHTMKGFVIFAFCVICFTSNSAGLKCYQCDDRNPYEPDCSSDEVVEACDEGSTFCATVSNKNDESAYEKCSGEKENCIQKVCIGNELCEVPGTYVRYLSYENITVTCCNGDLCNAFSSAYVSKMNLLYYILLFSLFLLAS